MRERAEREGLTDEIRFEGLALLRRSADGHNRDRTRGVPIIGREGPGGATRETDPVRALLAKEARGEICR